MELLWVFRVAENLRAALVGFASADQALRNAGSAQESWTRSVASDLELSLKSLADAVEHESWSQWKPVGVFGALPQPEEHENSWIELIRGQFNSISTPRAVPLPKEVLHGSPATIFTTLTRLPETISVRSIATKHALGFAGAVGLSVALAKLSPLPHAYWMPLTVAVLYRPDFSSTLTRGIGRLFGTISAIVLANILTLLFHPQGLSLQMLSIVGAWLTIACFYTGTLAYAFGITLYVIFSLSIGSNESGIAGERLLWTVVRVAMTTAAYIVWPIWKPQDIRRVLINACEAQIEYGREVASILEGAEPTRAEDIRVRARALRIQVEALVESADLEPTWIRKNSLQSGKQAVQILDQNAAKLLSFHARALAHLDEREAIEIRKLTLQSVQSTRELADQFLVSTTPS